MDSVPPGTTHQVLSLDFVLLRLLFPSKFPIYDVNNSMLINVISVTGGYRESLHHVQIC